MELGFFTMPLHPPGSDFTDNIQEDLDQIVQLDNIGYREAWVGEHFTAEWENIPSPDLFIAAALEKTKNIILGTGVSCLPNHNPFVIAHRIAQLDHQAQGRFQWGIGSGGFPGDFEAFGLDPTTGEHRKITNDSIETILQLWNNPKPGLYKQNRWEFTVPEPVKELGIGVHLTPFQKPHPPIAVAGVSTKSDTLVVAGEKGWMPMSIAFVPTPVLKSHWESVEQGAQKARRSPNRSDWRIAREIFIADTTEEAREEALKGVLARDFGQYFIPLLSRIKHLSMCKVDPETPDSEITVQYMLDNVWIVGSADDVANKIRTLYDDVGGFGVLLAMGHEWQPKDKWVKSMTRLAQEVMPKLADLQ